MNREHKYHGSLCLAFLVTKVFLLRAQLSMRLRISEPKNIMRRGGAEGEVKGGIGGLILVVVDLRLPSDLEVRYTLS